jgi:hypothetical protein
MKELHCQVSSHFKRALLLYSRLIASNGHSFQLINPTVSETRLSSSFILTPFISLNSKFEVHVINLTG